MNYKVIKEAVKDAITLFDVNYDLNGEELDKETLAYIYTIHLKVEDDKIKPQDKLYTTEDMDVLNELEYTQATMHGSHAQWKDGYIVDEEKSARWNREAVEEHNREIVEINRLENKIFRLCNATMMQYILEDNEGSADHQNECLL